MKPILIIKEETPQLSRIGWFKDLSQNIIYFDQENDLQFVIDANGKILVESFEDYLFNQCSKIEHGKLTLEW
jgi:hypothetical protein